jgi:hypothetical protein
LQVVLKPFDFRVDMPGSWEFPGLMLFVHIAIQTDCLQICGLMLRWGYTTICICIFPAFCLYLVLFCIPGVSEV